jgi:bacterioferritin-associated ferredoxin
VSDTRQNTENSVQFQQNPGRGKEWVANENASHYSRRMIVCICHRISDRDIARAVRDGCASFDELQDELSVATACGACHDCACSTFEQHAGAARCSGVAATATGAQAVALPLPGSPISWPARPPASHAAVT